jgi:UDP-glucose 4-epimerase
MINIDEAMDLIETCLQSDGYNVIPNLKSFLVKDLFEIYAEKFGLKWITGMPRISEKLHEMMVSIEEAPRTYYDQESNSFYMHYEKIANNSIGYEFTSDKVVVSKGELNTILQKYNYFKL